MKYIFAPLLAAWMLLPLQDKAAPSAPVEIVAPPAASPSGDTTASASTDAPHDLAWKEGEQNCHQQKKPETVVRACSWPKYAFAIESGPFRNYLRVNVSLTNNLGSPISFGPSSLFWSVDGGATRKPVISGDDAAKSPGFKNDSTTYSNYYPDPGMKADSTTFIEVKVMYEGKKYPLDTYARMTGLKEQTLQPEHSASGFVYVPAPLKKQQVVLYMKVAKSATIAIPLD